MKKFFKVVAVLIVALALAAGGGLLALRKLYPPQRLKAIALEKLRAALGRDVRIKDVALGFHGIDLTGVEVSQIPDFSAGVFLSAKQARVRFRLEPLLHKRVELADLALTGWSCNISKQPQASSKKAAPHASGGAAAAGAGWFVNKIEASDGKIDYEDPGSKESVKLTGVKLSASHVGPKSPFPISVAFGYELAKPGTRAAGKVELRGGADPGDLKTERFELRIEQLKIEYNGLPIEITGLIHDLAALKADLAVSTPKIEVAQARQLLGVAARAPIPAAKLETHIEQNGETYLIKDTTLKTNGFLALSGLPGLAPISAKLDAQYDSATLKIAALKVETGKLALAVAGNIGLTGPTPVLSLAVETNQFPLGDFSMPGAAVQPEGAGSLKLAITGTSQSPVYSGSAFLKNAKTVYMGQDLGGLNGSVHFSPQAIVAQAAGKWNQSDFKLDVSAKNYQTAPMIQVDGKLGLLNLGALNLPAEAPAKSGSAGGQAASAPSKPFHSKGRLAIGKISHPNFEATNAALNWDLAGPDTKKLTGAAVLHVGPGKFDNLQSVAAKSPLLKTALLPLLLLQKIGSFAKIPLFPAFDRVQYKEIAGNYAFKNGVMTIKESKLDSDAANVTATGTADLVQDQINVRVVTKLSGAISTPIAFTVHGSLESPSVKPDVASILKQPAVNDALEQGKKLLKGFLK